MVAAGRDGRGAEPEAGEAVAPNAPGSAEPVGGAEAPTWPDDAVESAFLAEAKERGEVPAPPKPAEDVAEEEDGKAMPAVGDLVAKIPPKVRDALEDLFRAKFVRVVRVPKKALKA
jgi:hypothetical protein